jgi:hypothetical protein
MTAINVIRFPNEVYVATDGLGFSEDGESRPMAKVHVIAHFPLVMALSGMAAGGPYFAQAFEHRFRSWDDIVERIEDVLPDLHRRYRAELRSMNVDDPNTIFIMAGWSAKRREAEAYAIGVADEGGLVPFKLRPIQGMVGLPVPPVKPRCELRRSTVNADMIAMMEAQRAMGPDRIGCFVQLTSVTKDCVTQRIIHRWNASVGSDNADSRK